MRPFTTGWAHQANVEEGAESTGHLQGNYLKSEEILLDLCKIFWTEKMICFQEKTNKHSLLSYIHTREILRKFLKDVKSNFIP